MKEIVKRNTHHLQLSLLMLPFIGTLGNPKDSWASQSVAPSKKEERIGLHKNWFKPDSVKKRNLIYQDELSRSDMVKLANHEVKLMGFNIENVRLSTEETTNHFIVIYRQKKLKSKQGDPIVVIKRWVGMVVTKFVEKPANKPEAKNGNFSDLKHAYEETDAKMRSLRNNPDKMDRYPTETKSFIFVDYYPRPEKSGAIVHATVVIYSKITGKAVASYSEG